MKTLWFILPGILLTTLPITRAQGEPPKVTNPPKPTRPITDVPIPNKPPPSLPLPDLVIQSIVKSGGSWIAQIKNVGTAHAPECKIAAGVSAGSTSGGASIKSGVESVVPPISKGGSVRVVLGTIQPLGATVDSGKQVTESNEKNNTWTPKP